MTTVNKRAVRLNNVRLSFANLFEPKGFNGSAPKYSANFLISKENESLIEEIKEAVRELIKETWPNEKAPVKKDKIALKDGDDVSYEGYEDNWFVPASNARAPVLKDANLNTITADDDKLMSGDYVNALVQFWAQDNQYGKRINCNIVGVQFVKEGVRFGGKSSVGDLFAKVNDDKDLKTLINGGELNNLFTDKNVDVDNPF